MSNKKRKYKPMTRISNSSVQAQMQRNASTDIALSDQTTFFSTFLSTDFLQLPQTPQEKRILIHHFYKTDPIVGQSIDLHSELPLSKVRLAKPKVFNGGEAKKLGFDDANDRAEYILDFFERMSKNIKLFDKLLEIAHQWYLDGDVYVFVEDSDIELPEDKVTRILQEDGSIKDNSAEIARKVYKGWEKLFLLPPDLMKVEAIHFTDSEEIELLPDTKTKKLIDSADFDEESRRKVDGIPDEIKEYIQREENIPLGTDPYQGSFCYHMSRKKIAYEEYGVSLVERCLRTLLFREKLRQTQTQIADRAMTPKRVVWGEDLSEVDVDDLREQVDSALVDPDFSIVTNYEVHWDEIGSRDRLLDLATEYDVSDKHLYIGLGVTESLLVGETSYGGDRLRIEVINTRYMLFREILQTFVEDFVFEPVARKKGFLEHDKWGNVRTIYPKLQFTRLALRDNQDTYDQLFNLYQKGSISIGVILELLNIDPEDTKSQLEKDMFTVNDAVFNELIRNLYDRVADRIAEETDLVDRLIKYLKLTKEGEEEGEVEEEFGFDGFGEGGFGEEGFGEAGEGEGEGSEGEGEGEAGGEEEVVE